METLPPEKNRLEQLEQALSLAQEYLEKLKNDLSSLDQDITGAEKSVEYLELLIEKEKERERNKFSDN